MLSLGVPALAQHNDEVFVFSFFKGNGESGVYLAWSEDGRNFHVVNNGAAIFEPPKWPHGDHLTRDPSIVYHNGTFNMVWTSDWSGDNFGHASSTDLKNWSAPQQVFPFAGLPASQQPKNVWAPEIHYDAASGDHFIVWASTTSAHLNDGDGSQDAHGNDHRLFVTRTRDFQSFTQARQFFAQGWSVIDGSAAWDDRGSDDPGDGRWVMVVKNEKATNQIPPGKNLRLTFFDGNLDFDNYDCARWTAATAPIIGPGSDLQSGALAEGPTLLKHGDQWLIYWDKYTAGDYGLASSTDMLEWTDETANFHLYDANGVEIGHPRHGTVFLAPRSALTAFEETRPEGRARGR